MTRGLKDDKSRFISLSGIFLLFCFQQFVLYYSLYYLKGVNLVLFSLIVDIPVGLCIFLGMVFRSFSSSIVYSILWLFYSLGIVAKMVLLTFLDEIVTHTPLPGISADANETLLTFFGLYITPIMFSLFNTVSKLSLFQDNDGVVVDELLHSDLGLSTTIDLWDLFLMYFHLLKYYKVEVKEGNLLILGINLFVLFLIMVLATIALLGLVVPTIEGDYKVREKFRTNIFNEIVRLVILLIKFLMRKKEPKGMILEEEDEEEEQPKKRLWPWLRRKRDADGRGKAPNPKHVREEGESLDMFTLAKFTFVVGFFLVDIPFLCYRVFILVKYHVFSMLLYKNFLFVFLRPYRLTTSQMAERDTAKGVQTAMMDKLQNRPRRPLKRPGPERPVFEDSEPESDSESDSLLLRRTSSRGPPLEKRPVRSLRTAFLPRLLSRLTSGPTRAFTKSDPIHLSSKLFGLPFERDFVGTGDLLKEGSFKSESTNSIESFVKESSLKSDSKDSFKSESTDSFKSDSKDSFRSESTNTINLESKDSIQTLLKEETLKLESTNTIKSESKETLNLEPKDTIDLEPRDTPKLEPKDSLKPEPQNTLNLDPNEPLKADAKDSLGSLDGELEDRAHHRYKMYIMRVLRRSRLLPLKAFPLRAVLRHWRHFALSRPRNFESTFFVNAENFTERKFSQTTFLVAFLLSVLPRLALVAAYYLLDVRSPREIVASLASGASFAEKLMLQLCFAFSFAVFILFLYSCKVFDSIFSFALDLLDLYAMMVCLHCFKSVLRESNLTWLLFAYLLYPLSVVFSFFNNVTPFSTATDLPFRTVGSDESISRLLEALDPAEEIDLSQPFNFDGDLGFGPPFSGAPLPAAAKKDQFNQTNNPPTSYGYQTNNTPNSYGHQTNNPPGSYAYNTQPSWPSYSNESLKSIDIDALMAADGFAPAPDEPPGQPDADAGRGPASLAELESGSFAQSEAGEPPELEPDADALLNERINKIKLLNLKIIYLLLKYSIGPITLNHRLCSNDMVETFKIHDSLLYSQWSLFFYSLFFRTLCCFNLNSKSSTLVLVLDLLFLFVYNAMSQSVRALMFRKYEVNFIIMRLLGIIRFDWDSAEPSASRSVTFADVDKYIRLQGLFSSPGSVIPPFT